MIVAVYYRVSTQRQEDEKTIEVQMDEVKQLAEKLGHTIVMEYIDDGWSGDILARPALDRLREDAKKGLWSAVLIYDPDRLARRYSYQQYVSDELEEAGIKVIYVTTPAPKNDEDKILSGVKGIFAEYERIKIAERMRIGKLHKVRNGNIVGAQAPYGYRYILKQGLINGYYEVVEEEARTVRMIFDLVANGGLKQRAIAKKLMELGIKPRKSSRGVWNTSTLTNMLRNETYIGKARFNSSKSIVPKHPIKKEKYKRIKKTSKVIRPKEEWLYAPVPAIITEELFNKARTQLENNLKFSDRRKHYQYLLTGLVKCICGRNCAGEAAQHGKHLYYRCADRIYSYPLKPTCQEPPINARVVDSMVWQEIAKFMSDKELLKQQIGLWCERSTSTATYDQYTIDGIKRDLGKAKDEEDRYVKAYGVGMFTLEQLQEHLNEVRGKISSFEAQLREKGGQVTESQMTLPQDAEVDNFAQLAQQTLSDLSFDVKKAILQNVVDKVVATQKEVLIYGYLPIEENIDVALCSIDRNCWTSKRWKIYII